MPISSHQCFVVEFIILEHDDMFDQLSRTFRKIPIVSASDKCNMGCRSECQKNRGVLRAHCHDDIGLLPCDMYGDRFFSVT